MSNLIVTRAEKLIPSVFDDLLTPWNEWFANDSNKISTIPAVNITKKTNQYNITVAAPGLKKDDFEIDLDGNVLHISAETKEKKEENDERYTRKEYNYSSFSRSFTLPDEVDKEKIEALYLEGILKITLPKREGVKKAVVSRNILVK